MVTIILSWVDTKSIGAAQVICIVKIVDIDLNKSFHCDMAPSFAADLDLEIGTTDKVHVVVHVHYGLRLVEVNLERDLERSWMLLYDPCDDVADEKRGQGLLTKGQSSRWRV